MSFTRAIAVIQRLESVALTAYPDPGTGGEPWTIGYGSTRYPDGRWVEPGDRCTPEQAAAYLHHDLSQIQVTLAQLIPGWRQLSEGQQTALLSFAYNMGAYFFVSEGFGSMQRMLRNRTWVDAPRVFELYDKGGNGQVLAGLVERRKLEAQIFLEGVEPMPKSFKALQDTFAKQSTVGAAMLASQFKFPIKKNEEIEYIEWKPWGDGHVSVELSQERLGFRNWLVFDGHCQFPDEPTDIKLQVPFYLQTDNRFEPNRTCNTSSNAMAAKFLGAKISGDDEYYQAVKKYGDTTDHTAQSRALAELGIKSQWRTDLGLSDLDEQLQKGLPIVIAILHRGRRENPTGGHVIVCIGRTAAGDYRFHDPYGSLLDGYLGNPNNGKNVVYSREELSDRWLLGAVNGGWGRIFD